MTDTTSEVPGILVIDDDEAQRGGIRDLLERSGLACAVTSCADVADAAPLPGPFDCVLVGRASAGSGLDGLRHLRERHPHASLVRITEPGDEASDEEAIRCGATGCVPRAALDEAMLVHVAASALETAALRRRLEEQHAELETFAGLLAHDLRAPARSIRIFAGFVAEGIATGKADTLGSDVERLATCAQRLETLVATLHDYTLGLRDAPLGPVALGDALDGALANLGGVLRESRAEVTRSQLPVVQGNEDQLVQLLQNLLANGITYSRAEVPALHVEAARDGDLWRLTVRDNGIGIPERYLEAVFEPFRRLHARDEYDGAGLGLPACRKIVERHGGRIWCESTPGEGSSFCFTLLAARDVVRHGACASSMAASS